MPGKIAFFSSSSLYRNLKHCCWFSNNAERRTGTWKWVNIGLRWYRLLKFLLNRNSGKLFTTLVKPIWKNRQGNSAVVVGEHSKKAFSFLYIFFPSLAFSCRWYFSKDRYYSQQQPHAMIWIQLRTLGYALELQSFLDLLQ